MSFTADFSIFFNPDEFGDVATLGSVEVLGMFTDEHRDDLEIEGDAPVFVCPTADLPIGTAYGTAIGVQGRTFNIVSVQPDATGLTVLVLEETT